MSDTDANAATFEVVLSLISLITDAPACKARVLDLQKQADQLRDLQAKLAGEREALDRRAAEHAAKVKADRADLENRADLLRRARLKIETDAVKAYKDQQLRPHDRRGDGFIAGSGLSREPDASDDPHFPRSVGNPIFRPEGAAS